MKDFCWNCQTEDVEIHHVTRGVNGKDYTMCITCYERSQEPVDPHLGCYSYPNCDIDPNGCFLATDDPEPYGHRG